MALKLVREAMQTQQRILSAAGTAFADRRIPRHHDQGHRRCRRPEPCSVYVHHRSTEQLLYLISLEGHQRTEELVREAVGSSEDPTEQLRAVMTASVFQVDQHVVCPCHQLRSEVLLSDPHGARSPHASHDPSTRAGGCRTGVARGDF